MRLRLIAALCLIAAPAVAQGVPPCADRTGVVARLAERYGEALQSVGMDAGGNVVEVWSSADGASWTILRTAPNGIACLIAAGSMWEHDAKALAPAGEPL